VHRRRRLLELLNVRYVVAFAPRTGWWTEYIAPGLAQVRARRDAILFQNPNYLPRCFFTNRAEYVAGEEEAFHRVVDTPFDPREGVVLEGPPGKAGSSVPVFRPCSAAYESEQRVVLDVVAPEPGWVVLLDSYDPGWSATIDGKPIKIRRADYLFRGMRVGTGRSRIELTYSDAAMLRGLWVALATLVFGSCVILLDRRRTSSQSPRQARRRR
jgi:hypothetical protein